MRSHRNPGNPHGAHPEPGGHELLPQRGGRVQDLGLAGRLDCISVGGLYTTFGCLYKDWRVGPEENRARSVWKYTHQHHLLVALMGFG